MAVEDTNPLLPPACAERGGDAPPGEDRDGRVGRLPLQTQNLTRALPVNENGSNQPAPPAKVVRLNL